MSAGGRCGLRDRYKMPRSSAICIGRSAAGTRQPARPAAVVLSPPSGSAGLPAVNGQMPYRVGTVNRPGRWAIDSPGARTPAGMTRDQGLPLLGQATLMVRSSCVSQPGMTSSRSPTEAVSSSRRSSLGYALWETRPSAWGVPAGDAQRYGNHVVDLSRSTTSSIAHLSPN